MLETGILPACAMDLAKCSAAPKLTGSREAFYEGIATETDKLQDLLAATPSGSLEREAAYLCDVVKPQMDVLRGLVDEAEGRMQAGLYPYPTYQELLFSHHH
mmetsp:Transcript_100233/g.292302  ORF Transcript_100233/g.292302 Transcript_100233/m.292302 type:complete len:102 (+) Transcript_100233:2-307(+)